MQAEYCCVCCLQQLHHRKLNDVIWRRGHRITGASACSMLYFFGGVCSAYTCLIWLWLLKKWKAVLWVKNLPKLLNEACCHGGWWNPWDDSLSPRSYFRSEIFVCMMRMKCTGLTQQFLPTTKCGLPLIMMYASVIMIWLMAQSAVCAFTTFICQQDICLLACIWWKVWNEIQLKGATCKGRILCEIHLPKSWHWQWQ